MTAVDAETKDAILKMSSASDMQYEERKRQYAAMSPGYDLNFNVVNPPEKSTFLSTAIIKSPLKVIIQLRRFNQVVLFVS